MPTFERKAAFLAEFRGMSLERREAFMRMVILFVGDLTDGALRPSLRVKRVRGHHGVWELTWASDGRATFEYGDEVVPGEPHIIWRRVGTHEIFDRP